MQNITKTCCNLCTELGRPVNCLYGPYWLPTRGHCYRLKIAKHCLVYFNHRRMSDFDRISVVLPPWQKQRCQMCSLLCVCAGEVEVGEGGGQADVCLVWFLLRRTSLSTSVFLYFVVLWSQVSFKLRFIFLSFVAHPANSLLSYSWLRGRKERLCLNSDIQLLNTSMWTNGTKSRLSWRTSVIFY